MSLGNTKYIQVKCHLDNCSEHLNLAYWTREAYHAKSAQDYLLFALSGCRENARENLIDLIASAIDDTIDVDWTSEQAAKRVVEVLLDDVVPPIVGGEDQ